MSKRLSAIVQRWMSCISRNSNFMPRRHNGLGGTCCWWKKALVIDAFHHGVLSQAVQEKLLADIDAQLLRLESGETDESDEQEQVPDYADGDNSVEELGGNKTIDRDSVATTSEEKAMKVSPLAGKPAEAIDAGERTQTRHGLLYGDA